MSEPITLVLGAQASRGSPVSESSNPCTVMDQNQKNYRRRYQRPISAQFALEKGPDTLIYEFTRFFKDNYNSLWGLEQHSGLLQGRRLRVGIVFPTFTGKNILSGQFPE